MKLVVGVGNVIDGWDLGLMSMHLGEKCDLFIKSEYGYGDEGRPPLIPGKAMVIFQIELLQVGSRVSEKPKMRKRSTEQLLSEALMQKNEGNKCFKDKKYSEAVEFYRDAIDVLDLIEVDRDRKDVKEMIVSVN